MSDAAAKFAGGPGRTWADDGADRIRGRLDAVLVVVAAVGLGLAAARPLIFQASTQSELRGVPYILALDLSRSMLTPDVRPNRWTAATNAIAGFLEEAGGDRVGLVTFSGVAYLNAPLSFDTRAIQTILRYTSPLSVDMDGETAGSDLGAAIDKAGRYFVTNSIQPRVVVLVTDGEDSGGRIGGCGGGGDAGAGAIGDGDVQRGIVCVSLGDEQAAGEAHRRGRVHTPV
jgi:Mg-chelatase subunit ChlD